MIETFNSLLDWIGQHPEQAGWVIFFVSLAESLAIVGVIVPGVIILVGAGTLIGSGVLDFWPMALWAICGAIIGDAISFSLGHHFESLTRRWQWLKLHPETLQKGISFFQKYGDVSIVLGRFFGPIRALVPLVAGMLRMPPKRFYLANIISAIVWGPLYLAPGYLIGQSASPDSWLSFLIAASAIAVAMLALFVLRRRF